MKRFLFAVAVVALSAAVSLAEDAPATAPTTPAPGTIVTPGTTYSYGPTTTSTRRGLFSRLRNRNTSNYSSYSTGPVMAVPTTGATPMPPVVAPPRPMPGTNPTSSNVKPGMVIQASGNLPPGTYTTTDGQIIQIGGTTPMTTSNTGSTRTGLFGRLRNR